MFRETLDEISGSKIDEVNTGEDTDNDPSLDLDVNMLKQMVSSRLKRRCSSTSMLLRDSYNDDICEIYLLQFDDNGPDCIAQLSSDPYPADRIASDVATMKYVAQHQSSRSVRLGRWGTE